MKKEDEIPEEKETKVEEHANLNNEEEKQQDVKEEQEETKTEVAKEKEDNAEEVKENQEIQEEKSLAKDEQLKQKKEEKSENIVHENKKGNKKMFIIISIIIVILLFLSTIFAIINMNNNNIINGVYIENIDVSGLNKDEVTNNIDEKINLIENVDLYYGDYNETVKLEDFGIEISAKEAIKNSINIGKSNNIIIDNFNILKAMILKTKFNLSISINEEKFNEAVQNIQAEIPEKLEEYSYEINNDEIIITSGKSGNMVASEELKKVIIENIKNQFNGNNELSKIPVKNSEPEEINIEKIYNEVYKEAKDAYIIEEPLELHKEEEGIDFAISIEEAKKLLMEEKETYSIPLKITKPEVEVKDLGDKLFKQTLAKYTTIYDAGNTNRAHNIALAAKTINGIILLPGETFSYNGVLGNTNKEKGYKVGTAYVGGKVVESYGGGICQVSSTLYNAVLYANLEIVERHNHSYAVNYVPAGRDATVAYGGKNFRFKNTRSYPIKIVASAKNGVISISIAGIKEEKEYEVVLTSSVLSTTQNQTVYEKNSSLDEGKEKVIQKGYIGRTSIAYKILKYNGKTISKTVLSKDTYKPMNRIVQIGTKKTANKSQKVETTTKPITEKPTTEVSAPSAVVANSITGT